MVITWSRLFMVLALVLFLAAGVTALGANIFFGVEVFLSFGLASLAAAGVV